MASVFVKYGRVDLKKEASGGHRVNWRFVLPAFAVGSAIKIFEERLRREQLELALTERFNRDDSQRLEEIVAQSPSYDQWVLMVLLFVSPRWAVLRFRRLLREDETRRDENKGL
jgi:hypothetical protein